MTNNEITIFLTPLDAELFKKFQQYHSMFVLMQQYGVFDVKFGSATLNFSDGILQNITKNEVVWHK